MEEQHAHNVHVEGSSPSISTSEYDKPITLTNKNLGYWYFIDYSHPLTTGNSGRVLFHRHVASLKYGRWLTSEEHVHHLDENKENNAEDNLVVLSKTEHNKIHAKILVRSCSNCGKTFNPKESSVIYCTHACSMSARVKNKEITKELLDELIPKYTWKALGALFGYSDSGIRDRAIRLGCKVEKRKNK